MVKCKLIDLQQRIGIRTKEVATTHGFRKFFTTQLVNSKVNPEIISHLHSFGFKLVPISSDGVTPCIVWTEIYEKGWDERELFKAEFANVATCFGKSHIKDENNLDVFLNSLDIDSKEVFDRLCIILDKNKKERFLINELRRLTFVTKTRKEC